MDVDEGKRHSLLVFFYSLSESQRSFLQRSTSDAREARCLLSSPSLGSVLPVWHLASKGDAIEAANSVPPATDDAVAS